MRKTARTLVCFLVLLLGSVGPIERAWAAAATVAITGPTEVTGTSFEVTVTFSEGVTGFAQSDVTMGNGSVPAQLGNLDSLKSLNLSKSQLSGSIPTQLGNLTAMNFLYLHVNQLSGEIPEELGDLTAVLRLMLNHNQVSGSIPTELSSLTSVQYLRLQCNQLTGTIPDSLGALTALETRTFEATSSKGASLRACPRCR